MKAVVFEQHGGPEVLQHREVPAPSPGPGEVLLRVRACALNHLDLWVRAGLRGVKLAMPHISGSDIAGEVVEVGALARRVSVGQKVVLSPGLSCGQCAACLGGADNLCSQYDILGYRSQGGYAELVAVPEVNVLPLPGALSFEEAASVPLVFLTAWHMLVARARVRPGETVLVIGAGSGVGIAAVQVAKLWGATVIATASGEEKVERARALGADHGIDHRAADLLEEVKRLTGPRGVDVVIEHVGTATWEKAVLALAPGGRLVTCGATTGYEARVDLRYLFSRHLSLLGSYMGSKGEVLEVLRHVEAGHLCPVVDSVFPLREAAAAQRRMEERAHFGKIVLVP